MFESVTEAVEFLEARHRPGRNAYRGQELRYPPHVYQDETGKRLTIESVYPRDYRFILEYSAHAPQLGDRVSERRGRGRDRRDRFTLFLSVCCFARRDDPACAWLRPHFDEVERWGKASRPEVTAPGGPGTLGDTTLTRIAWSLAQHYGLSTALLDVTFDPRVAGWFATQPWDPNATFQASGKGVIYRFDLPRLEALLEQDGRAPGAFPGFVQSLEGVPASFAARPAAQHGGSLCGFDRIGVVRRAFEERIVEPFEFRHSAVAAGLGIRRSALTPGDDPFLSFVREFEDTEARGGGR